MKKRKTKQKASFRSFRLHHKVIFSIIGLIGIVLVWRGVWTLFDLTPVVSHPLASLSIGFSLVALSGAFYKML